VALEDQEEAVLSACSSLVAVVKVDGSSVVQFSHPSVKEFLTSSRLAASSERVSFYHVSLEPAHTTLAQACFGVLLRLDNQITRDSIKEYPLAEYAARHWIDHANYGTCHHIWKLQWKLSSTRRNRILTLGFGCMIWTGPKSSRGTPNAAAGWTLVLFNNMWLP